jgi:hypothetical protein
LADSPDPQPSFECSHCVGTEGRVVSESICAELDTLVKGLLGVDSGSDSGPSAGGSATCELISLFAPGADR